MQCCWFPWNILNFEMLMYFDHCEYCSVFTSVWCCAMRMVGCWILVTNNMRMRMRILTCLMMPWAVLRRGQYGLASWGPWSLSPGWHAGGWGRVQHMASCCGLLLLLASCSLLASLVFTPGLGLSRLDSYCHRQPISPMVWFSQHESLASVRSSWWKLMLCSDEYLRLFTSFRYISHNVWCWLHQSIDH